MVVLMKRIFLLEFLKLLKYLLKKIEEEVNSEAILLAAILHDVGKTNIRIDNTLFGDNKNEESRKKWFEVWKNHAKESVPIAKDILEHFSISQDQIEKVLFLVENHDNHSLKEMSLELKILQDADLIADIGLSGFVRGFLYAGRYKNQTIDQIKYNATHYRFKIKDLNLDISKEIAEKELILQKDLNQKMSSLIDSELL